MAMMKIKNENGEWVPIAPTNFMHQFKMVQVPKRDYRSWDLSPYIQKNADFIICFNYGDSVINGGTGYFYSRSKDDLLAVTGDKKSLDLSNPGAGWHPLMTSLNTYGVHTALEMTYDEDTRILTAIKDNASGFVSEACLIYAG